MPPRKTSTKPTRIWKFAAKIETPDIAREILWRKSRYYNALVEIERDRCARFAVIRSKYAPDLARLESEWERLDEQIAELYRTAKRDRQNHWRESGGDKARLLPPEYEAKKIEIEREKRAVSELAKPMRAAFLELLTPARNEYKRRTKERANGAGPRTKSRVNAEVLTEMLSEDAWHPAWKEIARSDDEAHTRALDQRSKCKLYAGTYLDVEEAFARAKRDSAPRPPSFRRFVPEGKIQVQLRSGTTWAQIGDGERLRMHALVPRNPNHSPRANIRRVTFDQSVGDDKLIVSAICKLHRLPPVDADVKWISLVVRSHGCQLQVTLEHESFSESKRPSGHESPVHVSLGWARTDDGLRVARLLRDGDVIGEVHCPDRIVSQKAHAEHIESVADRLRVQALRRLRLILYRAGHRLTGWRSMESDRHREWMRRRCEDYARHVFGEDNVAQRWRARCDERKQKGDDLYVSLRVLRTTMSAREAFAWWCWIWAKKDRHLEKFAKDSLRRFANRRDAHYHAEAIRIATRFENVTLDRYSIAEMKKLEPLTMPGEGVRDMAQWQLHAAAPGRFREILSEVMGPRCTPSERPGDERTHVRARAGKAKSIRSLDESHLTAE